MTRWAAEVSPTNALPEYPRPQLVRADWLNLNGLWDYAITPATTDKAPAFEGQILVPFPLESALSGVMRRLDEKSLLWYRRHFTVPSAWAGRRVRLHFGAVDWQARVLVNGQEVGQHRGGYDGFSFDITESLKGTGEQELIVAVTDPTEGDQPRGKQSRKPEGIFYTPCSGIWQTVWLEPVSKVCIDDLGLVPDLDASTLRLRVSANSLAESVRVEAVASASGGEVGRVTGLANQDLRLALASPHPWSPDDPFLYDLRVTLKEGDRVLDTVTSYFGMRKIGLRKDVMASLVSPSTTGCSSRRGRWTRASGRTAFTRLQRTRRCASTSNSSSRPASILPANTSRWSRSDGIIGATSSACWSGRTCPAATTARRKAAREFEAELQRMVEGRRQPSLDHPLGPVQRRLGPIRHRAADPMAQDARSLAPGGRRQRLDRQAGGRYH